MLKDINKLNDKSTATLLNDKFKVQLAGVDDLSAVLAIYNQSIAGKQASANLAPVTIEERKDWFNEHLNDPKRPIYVVKAIRPNYNHDNPNGDIIENTDKTEQTERDLSTIVAWGSFSDLYARSAYHISSEISIYLHQDFQGQGLGSLLIQWMMTQAPALGIHNIVALIFAHNQPSLRLFRKLGFEQWGYMPQVCDMQGFIADVVMLGRSTH